MSFGIPVRNGLGIGLLASTSLATRNRSFSPALLFAANEPGGWYDPSDLSTMFQDRAGTTPVTATGQTVGLVLDKSRGLALGSELVTNGTFDTGLTGWTVGTDPAQVIPTWSNGQVSLARGAGGNGGFLQTFTTGPDKSYWLSFTVVSVSSGSTAVSLGGTVTVVAGTGNFRLLIPRAAANSAGIQFWPSSTNATIVIDNVSVKELAGNHLTQATLANRPIYQVDGTGRGYLLFDGSDDFFVSPTITPGIDKAQVFAGVRKLSDATAAFVMETSSAVSANTGAIAFCAPAHAGANYYFETRGTTTAITITRNIFAAPTTNVVTSIGDIAADTAIIRVDGTQEGTSVADQGTGNYLAHPMFVGRRGGTSSPFNGRIYSLIVRFGANLTATQIAQTEAWVNSKTGAY